MARRGNSNFWWSGGSGPGVYIDFNFFIWNVYSSQNLFNPYHAWYGMYIPFKNSFGSYTFVNRHAINFVFIKIARKNASHDFPPSSWLWPFKIDKDWFQWIKSDPYDGSRCNFFKIYSSPFWQQVRAPSWAVSTLNALLAIAGPCGKEQLGFNNSDASCSVKLANLKLAHLSDPITFILTHVSELPPDTQCMSSQCKTGDRIVYDRTDGPPFLQSDYRAVKPKGALDFAIAVSSWLWPFKIDKDWFQWSKSDPYDGSRCDFFKIYSSPSAEL